MLKKLWVRLHNVKVLVALVSGILLVLLNTGIIDTATHDRVLEVFNSILSILVAIGVFGNPESHVDDSEKEE